MRARQWPAETIRRFVIAWNEGVLMECLRERFGVRNPRALANRLRAAGHQLRTRHDLRGMHGG